jgi:hypothetical protein
LGTLASNEKPDSALTISVGMACPFAEYPVRLTTTTCASKQCLECG